ncbi:hypothetical protein AX17_007185 [Amanita inopinata Kibby_2008]|nr:hypothetical protein AX17_007185 [Amanita inopinata Kibby_2008]
MIPDNPRSRSGLSRPLKRGRACMNCRFLKVKCDGVKPICGPCRRHPKEDDCEYSDGPTRSRTQMLEETVSRLEARLHELEHPNETTPSVTLHDPYPTQLSLHHEQHQDPYVIKSPPLVFPSDPTYSGAMSPFSPSSTSSSLPSDYTGSNAPGMATTMPGRHFSASPFVATEESSSMAISNLLDKFLPHASTFGFFLDATRFRNTVLLPGYHTRPTPALLSTIYLWGTHLSRSSNPNPHPNLPHQERTHLHRALQHISTDLLTNHPQKYLHTLQAHVLISYYFFRTGRFIESKTHCACATSLAIAGGLHKIRSVNYVAPAPIGVQADSLVYLPPPRDGEEEVERVNGFWTVFGLSKMLAVALEPPSAVCGTFEAPGMSIDTPWPVDVDEYDQQQQQQQQQRQQVLPEGTRGNLTIRSFLSGNMAAPGTQLSYSALGVQACLLLHRATHLSGTWSPSMQQRDYQNYANIFQSTHHLLDAFRSSLPPLTHAALATTSPSRFRALLLTHALADAAVIKLHGIFAYAYDASGYAANTASRQYCLEAARRISGACELVSGAPELGFVSPIMGTLWVCACNVVIDEIARIRAVHAGEAWLPSPSTSTSTSPTAAPGEGAGAGAGMGMGAARFDTITTPTPTTASEEEMKNVLYVVLKALRLFSEDSAFTSEFMVHDKSIRLKRWKRPLPLLFRDVGALSGHPRRCCCL